MYGINNLVEQTYGFRVRYPEGPARIAGGDCEALIEILKRAGCKIEWPGWSYRVIATGCTNDY